MCGRVFCGAHCESINHVFVRVYSFSQPSVIDLVVTSLGSWEVSFFRTAVPKSTSCTSLELQNLLIYVIIRKSSFYTQDNPHVPLSHQNHVKYIYHLLHHKHCAVFHKFWVESLFDLSYKSHHFHTTFVNNLWRLPYCLTTSIPKQI